MDTELNYHVITISHFEIGEFSQYQYLFDQGLLNSGKKQGFTSHFVIETDWGPLHMSPVEQETGCACYHES